MWAQELDKQLADKPFQEEQLQQQLPENIQEKTYKKEKLELQEHKAALLDRSACSQQFENNLLSNKAFTTELWENELGMNLAELAAWNIQLYNHHSDNIAIKLAEPQLENNKKKNKKNNNLASQQLDRQHLSLQQPDAAIQLQQLCLQDPASPTSRQLPKEPLSFPGLQKAAWPAATLTDTLSFSKLGMNLAELAAWNIQLFNQNRNNINKELSENQLATLQKHKKNNLASEQLGQQHLRQQQPASQEHLSQLCLQDPASAIKRQLPKDSLPSTCLSDSSLDPAASLTDSFSFSTQKLSEENLLDRSFDQNRFFQRNFGHRISQQQLQQNLFQDQQQLQNSNFQKNFLASRKLAEKNFYKKQLADSSFTQTGKEACKVQLLPTCFPAAREHKQLYSSLVPQSVAKAASHKELCPAYSQRAPGQQELLHRELPEAQLEERPSARTPLQKPACREELLPHQLLPEQLSRRDLHQASFSASSLTEESFRPATFQTAALRTRPSDRQLQKQQLGRGTFQHSSFEKSTFDTSSFSEHSFEATTFDKSTLAATSFQRSTFKDQLCQDQL